MRSLGKWLHMGRQEMTTLGWRIGPFWLVVEKVGPRPADLHHPAVPDGVWYWRLADDPVGHHTVASGEAFSRRKAKRAVIAAWRERAGLPPRRIRVVQGGPAVLRDQATGRTFPLVDMSF